MSQLCRLGSLNLGNWAWKVPERSLNLVFKKKWEPWKTLQIVTALISARYLINGVIVESLSNLWRKNILWFQLLFVSVSAFLFDITVNCKSLGFRLLIIQISYFVCIHVLLSLLSLFLSLYKTLFFCKVLKFTSFLTLNWCRQCFCHTTNSCPASLYISPSLSLSLSFSHRPCEWQHMCWGTWEGRLLKF